MGGLAIGLGACNKNSVSPSAVSSFTIVNGVMGSTALRTNFSGNPKVSFSSWQTVTQNSNVEISSYTGSVSLGLIPTSDTTKIVYDSTMELAPWSIHSLFVGGTVSAPTYVFTTDTIPNTDDSVIAIRFANLYSGVGAVDVVLNDGTGTVVQAGMVYPAVGSFMLFHVGTGYPSSYPFQFKDAATGTLIASYTLGTLTAYLHKDLAVVLKGMTGGTGANAKGTFLVKYY